MHNMIIANAKYIADEGSNIGLTATVNGRNLGIPLDPANRHYAEILRQVEAGTLTIQDAE